MLLEMRLWEFSGRGREDDVVMGFVCVIRFRRWMVDVS